MTVDIVIFLSFSILKTICLGANKPQCVKWCKSFFVKCKAVYKLNTQFIDFHETAKNCKFNALNLSFKNVITTGRLKCCGMEDRTVVALLETKMWCVEIEWQWLGEVVRGTETVSRNHEVILQNWRLGGNFSGAHGACIPSIGEGHFTKPPKVFVRSLYKIYKILL